MSPPPATETDLVYQILDYLRLCGVCAWRQNTGGLTRTNDAGEETYTQFGVPGQSDILGILPGTGRFLAIEVKLPGNKPTDSQWEYLLRIQKNGGVALWVDCLEAVQAALPLIQAGAWIATDFDYRQEVTDEWTTSQALGPPPKPKARKKGTNHGADRRTTHRGNSRMASS